MKTHPHTQTLRSYGRAKIATIIAAVAIIGLIAMNGRAETFLVNGDVVTPIQTTPVLDGNTGKPTGDKMVLANGELDVPAQTAFDPKTGEKTQSKINYPNLDKMRDRLLNDLEARVKSETIEQLAKIETSGAQATLIVQREIMARLDSLETERLANLYKETAAPQIRAAIAKQIAARPDTKIEVALDLASATPDTGQFIEANRLLAEIVAQKASSLDNPVVAAFVYTQPFCVRMVLVDELMKRNQGGKIEVSVMVNAFVGLGAIAANRPDFFEAIMARPDRTTEMTALMLQVLDMSSMKG